MNNVIHLDQPTAACMTTYRELVKMYTKRDPVKYREAIDKNRARYRNEMDLLMEQTACTRSIN